MQMNTENITPPNIASVPPCFGCGACLNACPTHAIEIRFNKLGFLEPVVNSEACVSCGLCRKVCPKLNPCNESACSDTYYAGWSKDAGIVAKCSSGGICGAIATSYIKQGHIVYGAVWRRSGIRHVRVDKPGDLPAIFGSKYGQSNTGESFRQVLHDLQDGRQVLYIGTSCQIAALKKFLRKDFEGLLAIDIVCHGVPTRHLEEKFLAEQEQPDRKAVNILYRDKLYGWRNYCHCAEFDQGAAYRATCYSDIWMRGFISDIALNTVCYSCPFRLGTYQSDITCGDCWGASKAAQPFWNHKKGISVMVAHTDKGCQTLGRLPLSLHRISRERAIKFNPTLDKHATDIPIKREKYIQALQSERSLEETNGEFLNVFHQNHDVAILGMWMGTNYGGLLTSYALYKAVRELGYSTILLDHQYSYPYNDHTNVFWQFIHREHPVTAPVPTLRSLNATVHGIRTLLVGSDQVWNPFCGYQHYFYLDFARPGHRKVAYASSFGNSLHMYKGEYLERAKAYLQRFDAISVRENQGVEMLREHFGVPNARHTLDPVFLRAPAWWNELAERGENAGGEPYLLAYILNSTPEKQAAIAQAAKERGIRKVTYIFDGARKQPLVEQPGLEVASRNGIDVYSWLRMIRDADLVVTDSFHGTCFSIIFGKQVFAIGNSTRGMDRFTSLAEQFGLQNILVPEDNLSFPNNGQIDYERVHKTWARLKGESLDWLSAQLGASKRSPELQKSNEEVAAQFPPHRERKEEFMRLLMRRTPEIFLFRDRLKKKMPRLYGTLRAIKRKLC